MLCDHKSRIVLLSFFLFFFLRKSTFLKNLTKIIISPARDVIIFMMLIKLMMLSEQLKNVPFYNNSYIFYYAGFVMNNYISTFYSPNFELIKHSSSKAFSRIFEIMLDDISLPEEK